MAPKVQFKRFYSARSWVLSSVIAVHGVIIYQLLHTAHVPVNSNDDSVILATLISPQVNSIALAKPTHQIVPPVKKKTRPVVPPVPTQTAIHETPVITPTQTPTEEVAEIAPEPQPIAAKPAQESEPLTQPNFNAAYLRNPSPSYPTISRRNGEEGKVLIKVFVNTAGNPVQTQIFHSSGFGRLDKAAEEAIKQWRFIPAKHGSTPVDAWVVVPIHFKLES